MKKRDESKASSTSVRPARFRVAGAESKPLKSDLPAYERSFIDPIGEMEMKSINRNQNLSWTIAVSYLEGD